jgi:hypothetical protein
MDGGLDTYLKNQGPLERNKINKPIELIDLKGKY